MVSPALKRTEMRADAMLSFYSSLKKLKNGTLSMNFRFVEKSLYTISSTVFRKVRRSMAQNVQLVLHFMLALLGALYNKANSPTAEPVVSSFFSTLSISIAILPERTKKKADALSPYLNK